MNIEQFPKKIEIIFQLQGSKFLLGNVKNGFAWFILIMSSLACTLNLK